LFSQIACYYCLKSNHNKVKSNLKVNTGNLITRSIKMTDFLTPVADKNGLLLLADFNNFGSKVIKVCRYNE